jgi:GrpB-like predicted nucleotidyltransferase (UPF0157 family)
VGNVEIHEYDHEWPESFRDIASQLRMALGERAARIDHIGSTSVPGLASKDVIDVQVTVEHGSELENVASVLEETGWIPGAGISRDHLVPGWPLDERTRRKLFFNEPLGSRHAHAHVRVLGHPNQRYPLLCRDYLRAHPHSAEAYATLKRDLASILRNDSGRYADAKDAACDLIYFAAEDWSRVVEWNAGPSDA